MATDAITFIKAMGFELVDVFGWHGTRRRRRHHQDAWRDPRWQRISGAIEGTLPEPRQGSHRDRAAGAAELHHETAAVRCPAHRDRLRRQRAASERPDSRNNQSEAARRHFETGLSLSEHSRISEAIEALGLAPKVDPDFVSARALLGFHLPGEAGTRQIEQASQQADGLPEAERAFIRTLRAEASQRHESGGGGSTQPRRSPP
jgi:hypothetical protein